MSTAELTVPIIFSLGTLILMIRPFTPFRSPAKVRPQVLASLIPGGNPLVAPVLSKASHPAVHMATNDTLDQTRQALSKYRDIDAAIADGYRFPLGGTGQQVQLTNHWYAFKAAFGFDAEHPASLLYQRKEEEGRGGYSLVGAVFTAPARVTPDQLEARIPSSVAQWRKHECFGWAAEVFFCNASDDSIRAA